MNTQNSAGRLNFPVEQLFVLVQVGHDRSVSESYYFVTFPIHKKNR